MDKSNIVSSQVVLKMSCFNMDKYRCFPCHLSIASSIIDCSRPHQISMKRRFNSPTLWILSVVDTMLHDSPDLVIHRTEIWAVWRPQAGRKKVWRFLTQQFNCCTCAARCAGALSCWNTKSLPDTLRIAGSSMTSLWRRKTASKKSVRDITRIFCFVTTMKLLHTLQIYSTVSVKKCAVSFFKVLQLQTIGKVGNLIIRLWADR